MKKLFILLLSLTFSIVGCSNTSTETSSDDTQTTEGNLAVENSENKESEDTQIKESESQDKVEIEFWHAMSGANGESLEEIVNNFNESRDDISVKLINQGGYKDLFEKINASSQAGQLPALAMIYGNRLTAYVMNDLVEPLDGYINDENKGFDKEIWESIPEGIRDFGIWNGTRYSLPFNKSAFLMYYNEDALNDKNIEVPTTWEELRAAGEALTEDGKTGIVFNKEVGVEFSFWTEQAGGSIYDEETNKPLINTPENKLAYEFVTGLVTDGIAQVAVEDNHITGPMSRSEAFIGFASSSNLPYMEEACNETGVNWKVAELPEGKEKAVSFSGTDITMFNTISQEEKDAAFEFIKYWFDTDTQVKWGIESGYLPLTELAIETDEMQEYLSTDGAAKQVAINQFPIAFQDPKGLNGYAIHSSMQEAFEQIVYSEKTIEQALEDAQQKATQEMEDALKAFEN